MAFTHTNEAIHQPCCHYYCGLLGHVNVHKNVILRTRQPKGGYVATAKPHIRKKIFIVGYDGFIIHKCLQTSNFYKYGVGVER